MSEARGEDEGGDVGEGHHLAARRWPQPPAAKSLTAVGERCILHESITTYDDACL